MWLVSTMLVAVLGGMVGMVEMYSTLKGVRSGELQEYCHLDTFNASCPRGHVIMMTSAQYGRMRIGRCLQRGYGALDCADDVIPYLDSVCSGRQSCSTNVRDIPIQGYHPCDSEFSSYFEGSYACVRAHHRGHQHCPLVLTDRSGFISNNHVTSQLCLWKIKVHPGQRVNVTLYDFSVFSASRTVEGKAKQRSYHTSCRQYGSIEDQDSRIDHPICGGSTRVHSVFTSEGSQVDLTLYGSASHDNFHFLLHYEAIGCSRIAHPANSIVHYSENSMTITCNATHEKWYLTCRGNQWVGQIHNCTAVDKSDIWTTLANDWSTPHGVLLVVGIGVTLGVLFGAVLLTCVVLATKRYRGLCQCFPLHDPAKMSAHNHQPMIMSQHNHPITGKPTDHMMFDHAPSSAHAYQQQRSWLSQRPLPDPELEPSEMGMRQGADVLALCKDAPHDLVMEGTVGGVGRGLFDPLEVDPALEAYGASQAGVLVGPGEPGERYIDTSAPVMRYEHYPLPAGAIPVSYGPTVDVGGGTTVRTCYIAGNNAHLYETPGMGNRSELV